MRRAPTIVAAAALLTADCVQGPRAPANANDTYVRLERTACMGDCPIYTVTLYDNGVVLYEGKQFTTPGRVWGRIEPGLVAQIIEAFDRVPAWTCPPERITTDFPDAIVSVARNGQVRSIRHDYGDPCAPHAIRVLEVKIDHAGGFPHYVAACPEACE